MSPQWQTKDDSFSCLKLSCSLFLAYRNQEVGRSCFWQESIVDKLVIPKEGNFGGSVLCAHLDFCDSEAKTIEKLLLIHLNMVRKKSHPWNPSCQSPHYSIICWKHKVILNFELDLASALPSLFVLTCGLWQALHFHPNFHNWLTSWSTCIE